MGTPSQMISMVEFHPQWVQNPPMAGWAKTCCWGAHVTTWPLPATASRNSSGSELSEPLTNLGRTTHKKGCSLSANPLAISKNCSLLISTKVPKLIYETEFGACVFSQVIQLGSCATVLPLEYLCGGATGNIEMLCKISWTLSREEPSSSWMCCRWFPVNSSLFL